jgi:hypothetical protein
VSIPGLKKVIEELDLDDAAPYLVLGRKTGKRIDAGWYPISEDMQKELLAIVQSAVESIDDLEMSDYAGPTALIKGEEGMYVSADDLNADAEFLELLTLPDELRKLNSEEIVDRSLSFYAVGIGSDEDDRLFFVRRRARTLEASHLLIARIAVELRPIRSDVLNLERNIDFILHKEGVVVFDGRAFEAYVQDPDDVAAQMDEELDEISEQLPFDAETLALLKRQGRKGVLLRRRIHAIVESEYFDEITMSDLRAEFRRLQRDPNDYIKKNKLHFTMDNAAFVLKVLDESAWVGRFSGQVLSTNAKRVEA